MVKPMIVMLSVTSPIRQIDAEGAAAFAELVFDASRLLPLVLISTSGPHDRPLIDPASLYDQVGEHAEVACIANETARWALSDRLLTLSVWGGAVRIYLPDATRNDPWHRHPVIKVDPRRPRVALGQVVARIRAIAGLPAVVPAPLVAKPAPHRAPAQTAAAVPERAENDDRQGSELTRLAGQLSDKDRRLRQKDQTIAELRQQVQRMGKQLRAARDTNAPTRVPVVYADAEQQFRYEVEQLWLWSVPEADRDEHPLADYRLGRNWLTSIGTIELVDHRKILDVTLEVLTGRAVDSTGRRLRRMRTSDGGDSAPRVRGDGAVAWRCDLKQGTASAPRLMYWKLPDGTIELAKVAAHVDMTLR